MLSCDFMDELDSVYFVTLTAVGSLDFHVVHDDLAEPEVVDMAEAVHIAGILIRGLKASVAMVGRNKNELNTEVLAHPLRPGQTNGELILEPLASS